MGACLQFPVTRMFLSCNNSWGPFNDLLEPRGIIFFFCMLPNSICQTFIPHPYIFITLLYLHHCSSNHLYSYPFRAAYTPAQWIGTKWNKDSHCATLQPANQKLGILFGPEKIRRTLNKKRESERMIVLWSRNWVRYCLFQFQGCSRLNLGNCQLETRWSWIHQLGVCQFLQVFKRSTDYSRVERSWSIQRLHSQYQHRWSKLSIRLAFFACSRFICCEQICFLWIWTDIEIIIIMYNNY